VTACNTVGTVAGAFLAGFVLVPSIGLRATLVAAAAASGAAALLAVWTLPFRRRRLPTILTASILVLALVSPSWPRQALASGVGFFAGGYQTVAQWRESARAMEILYYKDGINTTLSVDRDASYRYYRSNGKTDASTHPSDMAVQVLIGQIPMLFHPDPKDVFVLGLGTGVSAAAVARHPVRSIDIVDIEAAGREAARYFEPENRNILADPRVRYLIADGRNALLARRRTYDVIISDPSDVWVAGVGSLFTKEFYETARSRLRPGGVMGQWWHTHALHPEHMKLIVATFRSVFPYASYWRPNLGDVVMVGSVQPLPWDYTRIRAKYDAVPGLADDLRSIGLWHPLAFFAAFVLADGDLDALLSGVRAVHTDDHPVIEFSAPRYLHQDTATLNDTLVQRPQSQPFPALANFDAARDFDPHATYLLGFGYASLNRFDTGIRWMEEAVRLAPDNAKYWIGLGNQYRGRGRTEDAEEAYRQALTASPGETEASLELSALLQARNATAEAEETLRAALRQAPEDPDLLSAASSLWIGTGRSDEALGPLEAGLARSPGHGGLHLLYGKALAAGGKAPEALLHFRQAVSLAGNDAGALRSVGEALLAAGGAAEAAAAFETAAALEPTNVPGLVGLARALVQRGDKDAARRARDRALALSPEDPEALAVTVN
jgi:spermidine synthase